MRVRPRRLLVVALCAALGCSRKAHLREAPIDVLMLPGAPTAAIRDASAVRAAPVMTVIAAPPDTPVVANVVDAGAPPVAQVLAAPGASDPQPQGHGRRGHGRGHGRRR